MSEVKEALFILDQSLERLENEIKKLLEENTSLLLKEQHNKKDSFKLKEYKEKTLKELYMLREVIKNDMTFDIKKASFEKKKTPKKENDEDSLSIFMSDDI